MAGDRDINVGGSKFPRFPLWNCKYEQPFRRMNIFFQNCRLEQGISKVLASFGFAYC